MKTNFPKKQSFTIRILNYISTAFAIVLLAMQFVPFWGCFQCSTCGDGKILSIMEYVWFANDHSDGLTAILKNYYIPGFAAIDVVAPTALILLGSIAGVVFCILHPTKSITALFPMIAGVACVIGYLTPAYQLGQNWQLHLVLGVITLLCSVVVMLVAFIYSYHNTKAQVLAELS